MTRSSASQRGSALLTAVVVIMVVMVLAVGIVRFASREVAGATALRQEQALVACAAAARQALTAQFHLMGFPANVEALNIPLGTSGTDSPTRVLGGHYDAPVVTAADLENVRIAQITPLPGTSLGPDAAKAFDITNRLFAGGSLGGRPYKVVVHCQDGTLDGGRQLEVEFVVRYGL